MLKTAFGLIVVMGYNTYVIADTMKMRKFSSWNELKNARTRFHALPQLMINLVGVYLVYKGHCVRDKSFNKYFAHLEEKHLNNLDYYLNASQTK